MRNTYIENNSLEESLEIYFDKLNFDLAKEEILATQAVGRVLAQAVYAKCSDPTYNASAMDGIAINSEKTHLASEKNPIFLKLNKDFVYVNTGSPIEDFDSVIMIEEVIIVDDETIKLVAPSYPYQHIRVVGESVAFSEMILPRYSKVRGVDLGALLSSGNDKISVFKKPKVGIIPTGRELVENVNLLEKGKLMESNCKVFLAKTVENGGEGEIYPIVRDEKEILKETILSATSENDIVIVNAGSSAGTKDFTVEVLKELGTVVFHGLAIKPGKPTILALVNQKPVIGIPGYPVSSYLVYDLVVREILNKMLKQKTAVAECQAYVNSRILSSLKHKEYIRVSLGYVGERLVASPLERTASNMLSIIKADGYFEIERNLEGVEKGEKVTVKLYKDINLIKDNLVICGSHDIVIDLLKNHMPLSSSHVGSMGGIFTLLSQACHIAPIHLLDGETGIYNISAIKKYFPDKKMALIKGLKRLQGFMVEKGNPKGVHSFEDLMRVTFANRQNGAGTRILLDYNLKRLNIDSEKIIGYNKEYTTHLAVAVAVKNKVIDCGLGVYSASQSLNLDFVPVGYENYDFLLEYTNLEDYRVKKFIEKLKSEEFIQEVKSLGGYETQNIGEIEVYG